MSKPDPGMPQDLTERRHSLVYTAMHWSGRAYMYEGQTSLPPLLTSDRQMKS